METELAQVKAELASLKQQSQQQASSEILQLNGKLSEKDKEMAQIRAELEKANTNAASLTVSFLSISLYRRYLICNQTKPSPLATNL